MRLNCFYLGIDEIHAVFNNDSFALALHALGGLGSAIYL